MLAPLGCGMQTGAGELHLAVYSRGNTDLSEEGAVLNVAKPTPDSALLISGMGGVGMAALFAAVSLGVKTIIAVDTIDSRLELVRADYFARSCDLTYSTIGQVFWCNSCR